MILQGYDRELMNLIPPDARHVLEVGCGCGRLGANYKRRNPTGIFSGITTDDHIVTQAGGSLDQIYTSHADFLARKNIDTDCLVIHLHYLMLNKQDPGQVIKQLTETLTSQGVVLLVFANHRHWSYLQSVQDIQPQGLESLPDAASPALIKFEQVKKIAATAGLQVIHVQQVAERGDDYHRTVGQILKSRGLGPKKYVSENGQAYIIVQAVKTPAVRNILIQSMTLEPVAACNDKRIHEPAQFLGTIPGVKTSIQVNTMQIRPENAGVPRILIWQRPILRRPASLQTLRKLIRAGYLIIVEFDDDPRRWQEIVDNDYLSFRGVHAVQTSTVALAEFLRQFNPEVQVFPNQMLELPPAKNSRQDSIIRIFFGALNRNDDWQPVMPALNRVLKKFNQQVHVHVIHDHDFFKNLDTSEKSFYPTCKYEKYLGILQECDIGLLPLESTEFNRYKSDLKFIEHAAHKVVALASPLIYGESIQDGVTGVIFHNADEFENKLSQLITDKETRSKITTKAFNWVKENRMLSMHYRKRYEWYLQLLDRLPELNRALRNRMPELFNNLN